MGNLRHRGVKQLVRKTKLKSWQAIWLQSLSFTITDASPCQGQKFWLLLSSSFIFMPQFPHMSKEDLSYLLINPIIFLLWRLDEITDMKMCLLLHICLTNMNIINFMSFIFKKNWSPHWCVCFGILNMELINMFVNCIWFQGYQRTMCNQIFWGAWLDGDGAWKIKRQTLALS